MRDSGITENISSDIQITAGAQVIAILQDVRGGSCGTRDLSSLQKLSVAYTWKTPDVEAHGHKLETRVDLKSGPAGILLCSFKKRR